MARREKIEYKTAEQIRKIRRAGLVVADIHTALRENVKAGMTTADADAIALQVLQKAGAKSIYTIDCPQEPKKKPAAPSGLRPGTGFAVHPGLC